jgi:hypothetical protein
MEEERYIGSVSFIKATEREIKSEKVQEKTEHKYEREKEQEWKSIRHDD